MNTNMEQNKCTDARVGNLIFQYELGLLPAEDQVRFEEHLLECDFCRVELEEMIPAAHLLQQYKTGLTLALAGDSGPVHIAARESTRPDLIGRIKGYLTDLLGALSPPKVYGPALGLAVVVVAFLILRPALFHNPYEQYLSFEPISERSALYRGINEDSTKSNQPEYYLWITKGINHFLDKEPTAAIEALTKADSLSGYAFKSEIWWYLFQSYLLAEDLSQADSIRKLLMEQEDEYSTKCDSIWQVIKQQDALDQKISK